MRRTFLVLSAFLAAVTISAFSAVLAQAQSADQYESDTGPEGAGAAAPDPVSGTQISQGTETGPISAEEERRIEADLAEEEKLPDYSQIVDNTDKDRFSAPGSKAVKDETAHEGGYALSDGSSATFEFTVPTDGDYAIYAWWPAAGKGADKATFSVPGASKTSTSNVDLSRDGGLWVKIGAYEMAAGEREIKLSPAGTGRVAADAVAIVRGEMSSLPNGTYDDSPLLSSGRSGDSDGSTVSARSTAKERAAVVRAAKRWEGAKYDWGTCTNRRMSCTCLTKRAWNPFGHTLPMSEDRQWKYEPSRTLRKKTNLHRGDVVFFKEGGARDITHVGIYSGNGYLVHSSTYFGKVVESKMKYINGFHGAIRMNPRK